MATTYIETGLGCCDLSWNTGGGIALVFATPLERAGHSCWGPSTLAWSKTTGLLQRLSFVGAVARVPEGKENAPLRDLRRGWQRILDEISEFAPDVERILLMGDTNMLRVAVPGLGKHGDIGDCHGTIFTLEGGRQLVPTFPPEDLKLEHKRPWMDRDVARCLRLTKPAAPLAWSDDLVGIEAAETVVIDLETSGLDVVSDRVTTLGLQWGPGSRALVTTPEGISDTIDYLASADWVKNYVFHNAQFDLSFMGVRFRRATYRRVRDTMLRAKSRGNLVNSLKHLGALYTASPGNYAWVDGDHSFDDPAYVCEDLDVTWRLFHLWKEDNEKPVVELMERAAVMCCEQSLAGAYIDVPRLDTLAEDASRRAEELRVSLAEKYGCDPGQQEVLCERLRAMGVPLTKKTQSGRDALTAEVLTEHGLFDILEYRKVMKLDSAFVGKMRGFLRSDGTVPHHQTLLAARTGRTSMRDFNWQQAPKKGLVKSTLVSRFKGGVILNCDLKSAEVFVASWVSEDERLAAALQGPDMHRANAARGFKKRFEDVTDDERFAAKALIFRSLFGGQPQNDAQKRVYSYMTSEFSRLFQWVGRQKKAGQNENSVTDAWGKVINLTDIRDYKSKWAAGRLGINAPIQGCSSHVAIAITVRLWELFHTAGLRSLVLFGVHDSFVCDVHPKELQSVIACVNQAFRDLHEVIPESLRRMLNVLPIKGEVAYGPSWGELTSETIVVSSELLSQGAPF